MRDIDPLTRGSGGTTRIWVGEVGCKDRPQCNTQWTHNEAVLNSVRQQ
jgi:hypothetical protein